MGQKRYLTAMKPGRNFESNSGFDRRSQHLRCSAAKAVRSSNPVTASNRIDKASLPASAVLMWE